MKPGSQYLIENVSDPQPLFLYLGPCKCGIDMNWLLKRKSLSEDWMETCYHWEMDSVQLSNALIQVHIFNAKFDSQSLD